MRLARWLLTVLMLMCRSAGVLAMFGLVEPGSTVQAAMNIPIAIQEMALAGWLIVKGFNASAIDPVSESAGIAPELSSATVAAELPDTPTAADDATVAATGEHEISAVHR